MVDHLTTEEFIRKYAKPAYYLTLETEMPKVAKVKKGIDYKHGGNRGHSTKYPWDEWFAESERIWQQEGKLYILCRGEGAENDKGTIVSPTKVGDYYVPNDAMPPKIKTAARRRYKIVTVDRVGPDGERLKDELVILARDMTAEERTAEDMKRAEEKAAGLTVDDATDDTAESVEPETQATQAA